MAASEKLERFSWPVIKLAATEEAASVCEGDIAEWGVEAWVMGPVSELRLSLIAKVLQKTALHESI